MTTTETIIRWQARGFTEDITTCDFCGKQELKGTVRMVAVDADGTEDEMHAGVVCAAKRAGTTAAVIRSEAKAADTARRVAERAHAEARSDYRFAVEGAALTRLGLKRGFESITIVRALPEVVDAMAVWEADHPAPVAD